MVIFHLPYKIDSMTQRPSICDMMDKQRTLINALLYIPSALPKYMHYRGDDKIKFTGASISIPPAPLIPYNDQRICCLLDKIEGYESLSTACSSIEVNALGPRGKKGIPYLIEDNGEKMVVKISEVEDLYSEHKWGPPTSLKEIEVGEAKQCLTKIRLSNVRYIASDEFTNETLISYVLNVLAERLSLPPLFVKHYQGAVCSEGSSTYGLNIMEYCDMGSLDMLPDDSKFKEYIRRYHIEDLDLSPCSPYRNSVRNLVDSNVIFQILVQITVGLNMLQSNSAFISGDLKAANILIKSDEINTEYKGIKLKAPFTCKIADYGKSSCMISQENGSPIRFYNSNTLANIYLKIHPFAPALTELNGEYYYTIGGLFLAQVYSRSMHMGLPFYRSFDYYTVLVSMLTHPAFYYMFFSADTLRHVFWDPIWVSSKDEGEEVMRRIRQYVLEGKGQSINDALTILKGIRLKCAAVDLVIKQILKYQ